MSVPLDRLYYFLADFVNYDLVIYRWLPHGSRNLEHLQPLESYQTLAYHNLPIMVCHDQEPLLFDAWSKDQLEQRVLDLYQKANRQLFSKKFIAQHHAKYHLKSALDAMYNVHDLTLLLISEVNGFEISKYQAVGFVPVYYWSHALLARDWFRYAQHDRRLDIEYKTVQHDFLIYNRAWCGTREYRLLFSQYLIENQLAQHCNTAFSAIDNGQHYHDHCFVNTNLKINNFDMHQVLPANVHSSSASADYVTQDYQSSAIEIVLETVFDDTRWHLTEKTLRSIACGQPFILCSTPGSLEYIRSYGFETFDGLIDESYDKLHDSRLRLSCIIKEMSRIQQLPSNEKHILYQKLWQISQRNRQKFFSEEFYVQVLNELKTNLATAVNTVNNGSRGKILNECINLFNQVPEYQFWSTEDNVTFDQHRWVANN